MLSTPVLIAIIAIIVILLIILITPEKVTMEYGNPRLVGDKIVVSVVKCTPASNKKCKDSAYLKDKVITFDFSAEKIDRLNPTSDYSTYKVKITNNDNINMNNTNIIELVKQLISTRLNVPKETIGNVVVNGSELSISSVPYCNGSFTTSDCFFNTKTGKVEKSASYLQPGCVAFLPCYECDENATYEEKPLCFPSVKQITLTTKLPTDILSIDELHFFDQEDKRITVPVPSMLNVYNYSNASQNTFPIIDVAVSNNIKESSFSSMFNDSYGVPSIAPAPVANPNFKNNNLNTGIRITFREPIVLTKMHILNINNTGAQDVLNRLQGMDISVQGRDLQVVRSYKISTSEPAVRAYNVDFVQNKIIPISESEFGKIKRTDEQVGNNITKRNLCLSDAGNDKVNGYSSASFNNNALNVKLGNCADATGNTALTSSNAQSFRYNPATSQIENPVKAGTCLQAGYKSDAKNPLTGLYDINLQLRKCDVNNPDQKFVFNANGQGTQIKSLSPNFINKCVDHNNTVSVNQYPLQLKDCDAAAFNKQVFTYIPN